MRAEVLQANLGECRSCPEQMMPKAGESPGVLHRSPGGNSLDKIEVCVLS